MTYSGSGIFTPFRDGRLTFTPEPLFTRSSFLVIDATTNALRGPSVGRGDFFENMESARRINKASDGPAGMHCPETSGALKGSSWPGALLSLISFTSSAPLKIKAMKF